MEFRSVASEAQKDMNSSMYRGTHKIIMISQFKAYSQKLGTFFLNELFKDDLKIKNVIHNWKYIQDDQKLKLGYFAKIWLQILN